MELDEQYRNILIEKAKLASYKRTAKACGNGAHCYVPKELIGKEVLIIPIDEK